MVECVSRKIQSKEMDKSFPFPGRKIQKEDENKNMRTFPLRTGQISQFPFRRLPWNNNVALNGFVIYSNSCLFLFGNPFYPRKCHSQMYECRNDPSTNKCLPICSNAMKWMWMKLGWIFAETSSWAKVWYLSWWYRQSFVFCLFLKKKLRTWGWSHDGRGKTIDAGTSPRVGHRWEAGHLLWEEILLFFLGKIFISC